MSQKEHTIEPYQIVADASYSSGLSGSELWARFCNGDQLAFAQIYQQNVESLFNFGCKICQDRDLVQDVIQDVFIRLREGNTVVKVQSIRSYLFKCVYHDMLKRIKAQKNRYELDDTMQVEFSIEYKTVSKQIGDARLKFIKKGIEQLTNRQRQAIILFFYEAFNYEEVAEALDLKNAKQARKLIYRAIDRMKPSQVEMQVLYSFLI